MQDKTSSKSYGMDDYSEIIPVSIEDAAKRKKRSIAIALTLVFLIILFYVTTIAKITENLRIRAAMPKKAADVIELLPVQASLMKTATARLQASIN